MDGILDFVIHVLEFESRYGQCQSRLIFLVYLSSSRQAPVYYLNLGPQQFRVRYSVAYVSFEDIDNLSFCERL
jgi:hypothetical protein